MSAYKDLDKVDKELANFHLQKPLLEENARLKQAGREQTKELDRVRLILRELTEQFNSLQRRLNKAEPKMEIFCQQEEHRALVEEVRSLRRQLAVEKQRRVHDVLFEEFLAKKKKEEREAKRKQLEAQTKALACLPVGASNQTWK